MNQKEVALSTAKEKLSELVDDVRLGEQDAVVIRKHEKPVAVLVEVERYQRMQELEDRFMQLELKQALRGRKYRLDEILRELGIKA
ncbi:MAG TPA: type II toxin-antitoxin system Phd/YefM family antitoxin [Thermoanaerobaculia bacterium]|nr:type II toxin-antitoxin system Phd/YefM family antitoxin [Thermoanaerobaculia bacterium]